MRNIAKAFLIFMLAHNALRIIWAGFGVSSTFAKVNVGRVEARSVVRVTSRGQPLTVANTSDIPVRLALRITRPKREEVAEGFEPIPTVVWTVLEKNEFTLAPGGNASTDVILKPSLDAKYRDKNSQLHIFSRVVSSGNIRIVMVHKLQFSIPKDSASSDFEAYAVSPVTTRIQNRSESSEFSLQPGEQKTVSSNAMTVVFDQFLPRNWISLSIKEFELKPGEKRIFPITIFIPNHHPFKSKRIASLIRVTQLDDGFSSLFVPVFIETTSLEFAEAAPPEFEKPPYVDVRAEMAQ